MRAIRGLGSASGGGAIRVTRHACAGRSRTAGEDRSVISSTIAAACATTLAPKKREGGRARGLTASNKRTPRCRSMARTAV